MYIESNMTYFVDKRDAFIPTNVVCPLNNIITKDYTKSLMKM